MRLVCLSMSHDPTIFKAAYEVSGQRATTPYRQIAAEPKVSKKIFCEEAEAAYEYNMAWSAANPPDPNWMPLWQRQDPKLTYASRVRATIGLIFTFQNRGFR